MIVSKLLISLDYLGEGSHLARILVVLEREFDRRIEPAVVGMITCLLLLKI